MIRGTGRRDMSEKIVKNGVKPHSINQFIPEDESYTKKNNWYKTVQV